jgi:hypothetical protein
MATVHDERYQDLEDDNLPKTRKIRRSWITEEIAEYGRPAPTMHALPVRLTSTFFGA